MDAGTHFHVHFIPRYQNDNFWKGQSVSQRTLNLSKLTELLAHAKL